VLDIRRPRRHGESFHEFECHIMPVSMKLENDAPPKGDLDAAWRGATIWPPQVLLPAGLRSS